MHKNMQRTSYRWERFASFKVVESFPDGIFHVSRRQQQGSVTQLYLYPPYMTYEFTLNQERASRKDIFAMADLAVEGEGISAKITLSDGNRMPIFGLGLWKAREGTEKAVSFALQNGYRLLDTAQGYE